MSFCHLVLARSRVIQLLTSPKCYVFPQVWALLRHMALMRCSLGVGLKAQQPTALPPAISLRRLRAEINIYTLYIYVYIATRWMWRYERVVWRKHIDKYALRLRREEMSRICVSFPKLSYTFMVNPIRPVYSCEYKPIAFLLPFWSISCHRVIVSSQPALPWLLPALLWPNEAFWHTLHSGSDTSNDRAPRPPGAIAQPVITEGTDAATDASAAQGMAKKWGQRPTIPTNKRKVQEGPRRTLWQFLFKASESLGLILYSSVSDIFWIHRSASFGDETLARGDLLRPAITSRLRPRLSVVETKMWKRKDLKDSSVK